MTSTPPDVNDSASTQRIQTSTSPSTPILSPTLNPRRPSIAFHPDERRPSLAPSLANTLVNFNLDPSTTTTAAATPGSSVGPSRAGSTGPEGPWGVRMTRVKSGYKFGDSQEDGSVSDADDVGGDDVEDEDHDEDGPRRGSSATDKTLICTPGSSPNGKSMFMGFTPLKKGSGEDEGEDGKEDTTEKTGGMGTVRTRTASSSMTKVDSFFETLDSRKSQAKSRLRSSEGEGDQDLEAGKQSKGAEGDAVKTKTLHQELQVDNVELYRVLEREGLMLDKIDVGDAMEVSDKPRFVLTASPPDHSPDADVEYAPVHPMPKTFSTARKTVIVCLASWITILVCMCASGFSTGAHVIRDEFGLIELEGMEKESGHSNEWVWGTFGGLGLYLVSLFLAEGRVQVLSTSSEWELT
jgi:hypothetical protein